MRTESSSIARRFARLTLLNVLANVTVPLASLVDTALLGHLEDLRFLAGVALSAVLFEYVYWSFGFLRMGTTGTTAQAWGRKDLSSVFLTLYRSLAVALALAALGIEPGPKWYTTGKFKDPEVRELAAKIKLENDPEAEEFGDQPGHENGGHFLLTG